MLLAATTINYIDEQILAVLAPFLQQESGWNGIECGYIVTAFQAAYARQACSAAARSSTGWVRVSAMRPR